MADSAQIRAKYLIFLEKSSMIALQQAILSV